MSDPISIDDLFDRRLDFPDMGAARRLATRPAFKKYSAPMNISAQHSMSAGKPGRSGGGRRSRMHKSLPRDVDGVVVEETIVHQGAPALGHDLEVEHDCLVHEGRPVVRGGVRREQETQLVAGVIVDQTIA